MMDSPFFLFKMKVPKIRSSFSLLLAISGLNIANAQHTEAKCNVSSLTWSFNSLGQSPCLVAAYLGDPCSPDGDFDVPGIGPGFHYDPPDIPQVCDCSTVTYSLLSACALCQDADVSPWSTFTENCTARSVSPDGEYPFAIPFGTAIPNWAYQPIISSNRFNVTLARMVGDSPENSTSISTSSSESPTSTQPSFISPSPSPSSPLSPTTSRTSGGTQTSPAHKSDAGVIAGSVVGGVAGLAIIGGLIAFFVIRDRKKTQQDLTPSVAYADDRPISHYQNIGTSPSPLHSSRSMSEGQASPSWQPGGTPVSYANQTQPMYQPSMPASTIVPRPYNPDDPSTFPAPAPGVHGKQYDRIPV